MAKMHSVSEASEPGPGEARWQVRGFRAEKSHPNAKVVTPGPAPLRGRRWLAYVHAGPA